MITQSKTCTTQHEFAQVFSIHSSKGIGKSTARTLLIYCISFSTLREISFTMTISRSGTQKHHHCLALSSDIRGWNLKLTCMSYPREWEWMREHWPDWRVVMPCQPLTLGQSNTCLRHLISMMRRKPWQRFTLTTWNGWKKQSNNTIYNLFLLWSIYGLIGGQTQIMGICWDGQRWGQPTWSRGRRQRGHWPEKGKEKRNRENKDIE